MVSRLVTRMALGSYVFARQMANSLRRSEMLPGGAMKAFFLGMCNERTHWKIWGGEDK